MIKKVRRMSMSEVKRKAVGLPFGSTKTLFFLAILFTAPGTALPQTGSQI